MSRALLACSVVFLTLCFGAAAHAQDERTTAVARDLFRQGVDLADHGQWADARDRFERAYTLRRSAVVAFNLASACAHLGRLVEAVERFDEVRRDPTATPEARAASEQQLAALRPRLGRLTIGVDGPREGTTLRLDGEELPDALVGVEAPADPGHHAVVVTRDGAEVARAEVDVAEGAAAATRVTIPPAADVVIAPDVVAHHDDVAPPHDDVRAPLPPPSGGDASLWIWVGVGAAVVVAAVVIIAVIVASPPGAMLPDGDTMPGTIRL